MKNFKNMKK